VVDKDGIPLAGAFPASVLHKGFALLGMVEQVEIHLEGVSPFSVCAVLDLDGFGEIH